MTLSRKVVFVFIILFCSLLVKPTFDTQVVTAASTDITGIYILAFDNDPNSSLNLTQHYATTVSSLVNATAVGPVTKRVVILADLSGEDNTHIVLAENGIVTEINGLPDAAGLLDPQRQEYNTASGTDLGGFLIWTLTNYASPTNTLSYVGHGTPLAPETNIAEIFDLDDNGQIVDPNPNDPFVPPLPVYVDVNPDLTDYSDQDLISPYDLALALEQANAAGLPKINVLDVAHCFGGSIEELYELASVKTATGAPYAETIIASPNYLFFAPGMLGAAFTQLNAVAADSQTAAKTLVTAYDQYLFTKYDGQNNDSPHPRIVVGVDSGRIPAIKQAWDMVSYYLLQDFGAGKNNVTQAYTDIFAQKYDTTYCGPGDYELRVPDALVDLRDFAHRLIIHYPGQNPVAFWLNQTMGSISQAVFVKIIRNGHPWFAPDPKPAWDFNYAGGISLYADFGPAQVAGEPLLWQVHWYTDETFEGPSSNQHPYRFVQGGFDGQVWQENGPGTTWSDVFLAWWQSELGPGEELPTSSCLPTLPTVQKRPKRLLGDSLLAAPLFNEIE